MTASTKAGGAGRQGEGQRARSFTVLQLRYEWDSRGKAPSCWPKVRAANKLDACALWIQRTRGVASSSSAILPPTRTSDLRRATGP